jgi:hypothetical protein
MAGAVTIAGVIGGVLAIAFGGARNSDGTPAVQPSAAGPGHQQHRRIDLAR